MSNTDNFKIKPRQAFHGDVKVNISENLRIPVNTVTTSDSRFLKSDLSAPQTALEVGYINFPTGRFSSEPKKGYTKVEFRKSVEKVTLEVDSEMMDKLREMGLVK